MKYREYLIWKKFLAKEEKDFFKEIGYGKKEIKKIGITKFINAFDWSRPKHVSKWRTNLLQIIICPECLNDFGVFDDCLGLCDTCRKKFDMDSFYREVEEVGAKQKTGNPRHIAVGLFLSDSLFRRKFLKEDSDIAKELQDGN